MQFTTRKRSGPCAQLAASGTNLCNACMGRQSSGCLLALIFRRVREATVSLSSLDSEVDEARILQLEDAAKMDEACLGQRSCCTVF